MASNAPPSQAQPQPLLILPAHHRASLAPYLPPHSQTPSNHPPSAQHPSTTTTTTPSPPSPSPPLPHLTLTYATSLDASLALAPGLQTPLSDPNTKAMTHYLRSTHDAILIGATTAIVDDPRLNCRHASLDDADQGRGQQAVRQPIPVILDPSGRWGAPRESRVLGAAREGRGRGVWWVVVGEGDEEGDGDARRRREVEEGGGEVVVLGAGLRSADGGIDWGVLLAGLAARGVRSVMVEGGARVIMDLLKEGNRGFVSSVVVTIAPVWLGEGGVVVSPPRREAGREVGRLEGVRWVQMGEDVVMAGRFAGSW